ncbi:MAG TPA: endolytic transglycosylase MltG, partial [Chroococcales cyanobacterium]
RVSPYNTRMNTGLPPGPVSSPGLSCMQAAVHPAKTAYIYYVRNPARNDGAHNFYVDDAGFEKGVQALRQWERKRDQSEKLTAEANRNAQSGNTSAGSQAAPPAANQTHHAAAPAEGAPAHHATASARKDNNTSRINNTSRTSSKSRNSHNSRNSNKNKSANPQSHHHHGSRHR